MQLQTTAVMRDRFQLTIPDQIRLRINWLTPGSVVTISQSKADEIVITPHVAAKNSNWNRIWRSIKLARSHIASYKGSLSEFIVSDREHH